MGSQGIPFTNSLIYSGLGLAVVFLALAMLAVVIILFSRLFKGTTVEGTKTTPATGKNFLTEELVGVSQKEELDLIAAIIAAVVENARSQKESVIVTSIRELS